MEVSFIYPHNAPCKQALQFRRFVCEKPIASGQYVCRNNRIIRLLAVRFYRFCSRRFLISALIRFNVFLSRLPDGHLSKTISISLGKSTIADLGRSVEVAITHIFIGKKRV
jgi:hypothetical protein